MADPPLKTTPLHAIHQEMSARMMPFGGYDMPVQYTSIIDEHLAVREAAGLFDVSHMGEVEVTGPHALDFVQHLVTNDASNLYDGRAMYTVMCTPEGGVVDDLIVYRRSEDTYLLVINAANIDKDWDWMVAHNPMKAELRNRSNEFGLLALQGPRALDIAASLTDVAVNELKFYHFAEPAPGAFLGCEQAILSRTGYTGEPGLEIYCEAEKAPDVWHAVMEAGADYDLQPAGLGARDTLRLEAGYCLYGNDLDEDHNPLEAGLGWLVKLDKGDFIGRKALQQAREDGLSRKLVGFVLDERGIPRHGYPIVSPAGEEIGTVTSGSQSPVLQQGIGLGYVVNDAAYTEPGQPLQIGVRGRMLAATVRKPPFHKQ
jgi:aminomethyltransferase